MSAKKSKSAGKPAAIATPAPASNAAANAPAAVVDPVASAWIDSTDPRKRLWGKIILAAVWIYVAALWLLALDQTFHWGIFGPKVPPLP